MTQERQPNREEGQRKPESDVGRSLTWMECLSAFLPPRLSRRQFKPSEGGESSKVVREDDQPMTLREILTAFLPPEPRGPRDE